MTYLNWESVATHYVCIQLHIAANVNLHACS